MPDAMWLFAALAAAVLAIIVWNRRRFVFRRRRSDGRTEIVRDDV